MTIRSIVRYPDPRLALPAQPVTAFDGTLRELASDLFVQIRMMAGTAVQEGIDQARGEHVKLVGRVERMRNPPLQA